MGCVVGVGIVNLDWISSSLVIVSHGTLMCNVLVISTPTPGKGRVVRAGRTFPLERRKYELHSCQLLYKAGSV